MNSQDQDLLDKACRDAVHGAWMELLKAAVGDEMNGEKPCAKCKKTYWANQLLFFPEGRICFECANVRCIE